MAGETKIKEMSYKIAIDIFAYNLEFFYGLNTSG